MAKDVLFVGEVVKPQGIKGEVKVMPLTDDPHQLARMERIIIGDQDMEVLGSRVEKNMVVMQLSGIADRNAAESLRGKKLAITRDMADELPEGQYYIVDLIGCQVVTDEGEALGTLKDILQNGPKDVYIVKGQRGSILFPALKELLLDVDIEAKAIKVNHERLQEVAVYED